MIEVFYSGYAFTITKSSYGERYYSTVTLESDRGFRFWGYDVSADTWEQCLSETLKCCDCIHKDYGLDPPIGIGEKYIYVEFYAEKTQDNSELNIEDIPF